MTPAMAHAIKLPITFDVSRLQNDVKDLGLDHFIYYNVLQLRAPAHMVDPSLPMPPPAEDYADGTWTPWLDSPLLEKSSYLKEVVEYFKEHATVNLIRLLRLEAGAIVKEHTDPTLGLHIHKSMIRLTIPIFQSRDVQFILAGEQVPMQEGECWYMNLTEPHSVNNSGTTERINLTIDIIPNDWIRSLIEN